MASVSAVRLPVELRDRHPRVGRLGVQDGVQVERPVRAVEDEAVAADGLAVVAAVELPPGDRRDHVLAVNVLYDASVGIFTGAKTPVYK